MPVEILVKMILAGNSNSFLSCKNTPLHLRGGIVKPNPSEVTFQKLLNQFWSTVYVVCMSGKKLDN